MTAPEPGPLADELARLVGAAQDWLHRSANDRAANDRAAGDRTAEPAAAGSPGPRLATGSPECCWCPICQLIVTVRGERPELLERLADAQSAIAGLLRAAADAASRSDRTAGRPAEPAEPAMPTEPAEPAEPAGPARVHRIPLDTEAGTGDSAPESAR